MMPLLLAATYIFFNNFVDKLKLNTVINKNIWFVIVTVYTVNRVLFGQLSKL